MSEINNIKKRWMQPVGSHDFHAWIRFDQTSHTDMGTLLRVVEAMQWKPIASAPIKGRFLALMEGGDILIVRMMRDGIEGFTDERDVWYPTHWMPLPSPYLPDND